jgi:hemoglobin
MSFAGEKSNEAKWRVDKMALMFLSKIEYYKTKPATSLI